MPTIAKGVLPGPKPSWLRAKAGHRGTCRSVSRMLAGEQLHTVCQQAQCPNIDECFSKHTATFLIMGEVCTRNCRYCAVHKGQPAPLDAQEPPRVAEAAAHMQLKHAVITSVTRDDLPDGGAAHFVATIRQVRQRMPNTTIEVLIPDLQGAALHKVIEAAPDVFNHNIETVARLFPVVRSRADYHTSLKVLAEAARAGLVTKSGFMVGLGERREEVLQTLGELARAGCRIVTIGQYLPPSVSHHPAARYVHPDEFAQYAVEGEALGIDHVFSGPLVRSSYMAEQVLQELQHTAGRSTS